MKKVFRYLFRALYIAMIIFHIISIVIGVARWHDYCRLIGECLIALSDYLLCRYKAKRAEQAKDQETWPPRGDL